MLSKYVLYFLILRQGKANKALNIAQSCGARGGTILSGVGTVPNKLLRFLGLDDVKKDIVLIAVPETISKHLIVELRRRLKLDKQRQGIVFRLPVAETRGIVSQPRSEGEAKMDTKFQLIMTIVNRGQGNLVVSSATAMGSTGATIISGRGSAINNPKIFNIEIDPEKEVVLIVSEKVHVPAIRDEITKNLRLDQPNTGVIFIIDIEEASGLYLGE